MGNSIKLKVAFAKGVGRSHIATNTPCQDYVASKRDSKKGLLSITLSDGAGSCDLSHIGSRIIVKIVNNNLIKNFDYYYDEDISIITKNIITEIILELNKRSFKDKQDSIKSYSGTLLCVATNGENYISLHLGDGVIGYIENNAVKVLSEPSNGEYSNTTYFVTDKNAILNTKVYKGRVESISSFIIMSDGTEESLYDKKNKSIAQVYLKMSNWLSQYREKKVSKILCDNIIQVFTKKSMDDCSIGILNIIK